MNRTKTQIGCGYCINEKNCPIRNPRINKAKLGCVDWKHYTGVESYKRIPRKLKKKLKKNYQYYKI